MPKNPLKAPNKTKEKITPLQKLRIFIWLFLSFEPPIYAIVIGIKDKEQGPKLVKSPALKIIKKVIALGLLTASCISKFPFWANSEITKLNSKML